MKKSVNKFIDTIDNLDFSQEYQVIDTIDIIKTQLIASKCLYKDERKNIDDNNEIFNTFEEESKIGLTESILTNLK